MIRAVLWLIGIFGPLLAMKAGLMALEKTRDGITIKAVAATFSPSQSAAGKAWISLREISAVPLAAGILGAWFAACLLGLAALSAASFGAGQVSGHWAPWSRVVCAALAAAILFFPDVQFCGFKSLFNIASLARAALALIAMLLACLPPRWLAVAGFAFLAHAFFLIDRRRDCPDCDRHKNELGANPKPWLLLGLLGLCGVMAMDQFGLPVGAALIRSASAAACGAVLGALSILLRARLLPHAEPQERQIPGSN